MGFFRGPNIVRDGLVLYLDAASPRSYPGSGTTWSDLSGNGNDGTLVNGPTFDSGNNGSIIFDGVDDYVELGSITSDNILMLNGSEVTICSFFKKESGGDAAQRIVDKSTNHSGVGGYAMWIDSQRIGYSVGGSNWRTNNISPVVLGEWNHVCVVSGPSSTTSYLNGIEFPGAYYTNSHTTPPNTTANLRVGTWYNATSREFNGSIVSVFIYNRTLTQEEILQNYNAQKSRFGL